MLTALTIQNVVLIEKLSIEFKSGFCGLTGETGAGKSILLDSLGLALGARSESSLVRKGAEKAQVTAQFKVNSNHIVHSLLAEADLEVEKSEPLILRRSVKADGGSKAFINDQSVSIGLLKQIGDLLVEIHGQFDTQGLLDPKTHLGMLDEYAGIDPSDLCSQWNALKQARRELEESKAQLEKARSDELYLRQAIEDLDALSPENGEEEKLASLREKLMRRDQYLECMNNAYELLTEVQGTIGSASRILEKLDDDGTALIEGLDRSDAELQEVLSGLQSLSADLEENEYSLPEIDDRLFALRGLARKHECCVDDLPSIRHELANQLNMIEMRDDYLASLAKKLEQAKLGYLKSAKEVSGLRQKAASKLDKLIAKELPPLKLEKASFITSISEKNDNEWNEAGIDNVNFLVATNPGSAPGPLNKIASGGEMSRFMLALKVVMAQVGAADSLIFDEVDSGIGGATASAVGDRLARLSHSKQILVVTHSPQVAARASHHWIVLKDGKEDVRTKVIPLDEVHERREEIARMLSGSEITGEARAAADKLMESGK